MPRAALLRGRKPWVTPARALVEQYGIPVLPPLPEDSEYEGRSTPDGIAMRQPVKDAVTFTFLVHEVAHQVHGHHTAVGRNSTYLSHEVEAWTWTCEWIEEHADELPPSAVRVARQQARQCLWRDVKQDMDRHGLTEFTSVVLADTRWADLPAVIARWYAWDDQGPSLAGA